MANRQEDDTLAPQAAVEPGIGAGYRPPPEGRGQAPRPLRPVESASTSEQGRDIANRGGIAVMDSSVYGTRPAQDAAARQASYSANYLQAAKELPSEPAYAWKMSPEQRATQLANTRAHQESVASRAGLLDVKQAEMEQQQAAIRAANNQRAYDTFVTQRAALEQKQWEDYQFGRSETAPNTRFDPADTLLQNGGFLAGTAGAEFRPSIVQTIKASEFRAPGEVQQQAAQQPSGWDPNSGARPARIADVMQNPKLSDWQKEQHLRHGPDPSASPIVKEMWAKEADNLNTQLQRATTPYINAAVAALVGPQGAEETAEQYKQRTLQVAPHIQSSLLQMNGGQLLGANTDDILSPEQFAANLALSRGFMDKENTGIRPSRFGFDPSLDQVKTGGNWAIVPDYEGGRMQPAEKPGEGAGVFDHLKYGLKESAYGLIDGPILGGIPGSIARGVGNFAANASNGYFDTGKGNKVAVVNEADPSNVYYVTLTPQMLEGLPRIPAAQLASGTLDPGLFRLNRGGGNVMPAWPDQVSTNPAPAAAAPPAAPGAAPLPNVDVPQAAASAAAPQVSTTPATGFDAWYEQYAAAAPQRVEPVVTQDVETEQRPVTQEELERAMQAQAGGVDIENATAYVDDDDGYVDDDTSEEAANSRRRVAEASQNYQRGGSNQLAADLARLQQIYSQLAYS